MLVADSSLLRATVPWTPHYDDLDMIIEHALAWEKKLTELRNT
mgnify:FL=1